MDYHVGQKLFVLVNKKDIIPITVVKKVSEETVTGNQVEFFVKTLLDPAKREVPISSMRGEIFSDLNEIREVLLKRWTEVIDTLIEKASEFGENDVGRDNREA